MKDDVISRQAAIDKWKNDFRDYVNALDLPRDDYNGIMEYIDELPSAQPEQRWIPCGERLPEKPNMYTVTDSKGNVVRFVFYDTKSSREYWQRCAKAWMPLPEPYREERRTDDGE